MSATSWVETTLGEVAEIVGGATPKTSVDDYWGGDVYWATPKDLSGLQGAEIRATSRRLTRAGLRSCAARVLPPGSVLLSSRAPIGLVAINSVPMATNQGFKSLIPDRDRVDAKFLYWWLRRNRAALEAMGTGATFKEISKKTTAAVPIELPPIEEQRRIAAVLDAADGLRARRREALAKLDTLTQAVFADIFGRLGAYDRKPFGDLLVQSPRNGISPSSTGTVSGRVLTLDAITRSGFDAGCQKEGTFAAPHARDKTVDERDFLICRGNGNLSLVARAAFPDENLPEVAFPDTVIAARPDPELVGRAYLAHVWTLDVVRRQVEALARTTNGTHKINQGAVASIEIPTPPLAEQARFANAVEAIGVTAKTQKISLEHLDTLFVSLRQRAFRGEL